MSARLQKGIDITPNGVIRPGSLQDYRVLRAQSWHAELLQTTSHLRLWANWPTLQPDGALAFGDPAGAGHANLLGLDEQIQLANADGLRVILLPYRYPGWANGTAHVGAETDDYLLYEPQDRVRASTWLSWHRSRGTPDEPERRAALRRSMRQLGYGLPADGHGPDSAWGRYVAALVDRYVDHAEEHGRVHYLEVVNEPNFQLWPQRSPAAAHDDLERRFDVEGSALTVHRAVAEMMCAVDTLACERRGELRCLAPSTSDSDIDLPRLVSIHTSTPYAETTEPFVEPLLDELDCRGFRGGRHWIWSFHNYNDVELAQDRALSLRARLCGRWRGRRADGGPALFCTETGVRLTRVQQRFGDDLPYPEQLRLQASVLEEAVLRHARGDGVGAGVELFTQYTVPADPNFDCGLREADYAHRPAFDTWAALPEGRPRQPAVVSASG